MISIIILIIILGCAAAVVFKLNIIRAFAAIIDAICANMVAFNFFEAVTGFLGFLGSWAQPFGFLLLFALVFALLQTAIVYLTRDPVDFGFLPERIGRAVLGLILGFIVSGFLLTFLAMAPLSSRIPYRRFDSTPPDPNSPNKLLLNVDGFVTGMFSNLSNGSFRGSRSFATVHPSFLDQLFLDRINEEIERESQRASSSTRTQRGAGASRGRGGRQGPQGDTQRGGRGFQDQQGEGGFRGGRQGEGFQRGQPGDMQEGGRGFPDQQGYGQHDFHSQGRAKPVGHARLVNG